MLKKLRIKFVAYSMSIVVIMLAVIFGMVYHFTAQSLEAESLALVQRLSGQPALPERPGLPENGPGELKLPYFVVELNFDGRPVATSGGYYDLSDAEFLDTVVGAALDAPEQSGLLREYDLRFFKANSPQGSKIVFVDTSSQRTALTSLVRTCAAIGAASLLAFFGASLLLAHFAVKPVEQAWEQQRQFVADASHELKTPLTVICTSAELLQGEGRSSEERQRFSESILVMGRQMRALVENLLELARVDSGSPGADFQELDLSALAEEAVLPFEPLFFESGLELCSSIAPKLRTRGSPRQLAQVLDILLDNAQKYSRPGSRVVLSLSRQGGHCLLSLESPGQALSRQELKDIFKRFYRADKVRGCGGSYGLGLPIARGIVSAHRGRIWAESREGRNVFHVLLPAI